MLSRTTITLLALFLLEASCAPTVKDPMQQLIHPIADTPVAPIATTPPSSTTTPPSAPSAFAFSATTLSVSVLSQIDYRATPPSVDVRIECRDQLDDLCKGVGVLRMKLTGSLASQVEYAFEVPLTTLPEQSAHWESVTSTYLARLAPPWADSIAAGCVVRVTATLEKADGSSLHATGEIQ